MATLNKVFVMGNLGQDPELRYTSNQNPVATLSVATKEVWTGKDGQRQESTEWHRVVVWGKQAENCNKYLAKGRAVFVEGRLQTRSWDDKNGQKRYTTEINASNVQFMPSATGPSAGMGDHDESPGMAAANFPMNSSTGGGSPSSSDSIPNLDDIPF